MSAAKLKRSVIGWRSLMGQYELNRQDLWPDPAKPEHVSLNEKIEKTRDGYLSTHEQQGNPHLEKVQTGQTNLSSDNSC